MKRAYAIAENKLSRGERMQKIVDCSHKKHQEQTRDMLARIARLELAAIEEKKTHIGNSRGRILTSMISATDDLLLHLSTYTKEPFAK